MVRPFTSAAVSRVEDSSGARVGLPIPTGVEAPVEKGVDDAVDVEDGIGVGARVGAAVAVGGESGLVTDWPHPIPMMATRARKPTIKCLFGVVTPPA